jgi:hypothetical protein
MRLIGIQRAGEIRKINEIYREALANSWQKRAVLILLRDAQEKIREEYLVKEDQLTIKCIVPLKSAAECRGHGRDPHV